MTRALFLLLLLLLPATTAAYVVYDINCENVASIRIERHRDTKGNVTSLGWYHTVHFDLTPEAALEFTRLRDATPKIVARYRDNHYLMVNVRMVSRRHQLPLTALALTTHGDTGPTFVAVREREAFELARAVCPALVPPQVLVEGRLVDPDPANPPVPVASFPPTGDLPYDLSCANVKDVTIVRLAAGEFPETRARGGHFHVVFFRLTPDAADSYQPILQESRRLTPRPDAPGAFTHRRIAVTTGGQPLRSDVPEIEAHSSSTVNTYIIREKDALDTAHLVCPTAPVRVFRPPDPPSR